VAQHLPGSACAEEQEELAQELDAGFKSKRYSFTQHWDRVIIGYREYERSTLKFSQRNQRLIRRLTEAVVRAFIFGSMLTLAFDPLLAPQAHSLICSICRGLMLSYFHVCMYLTSTRWAILARKMLFVAKQRAYEQDGEMRPHVDSVSFSGSVVAGLSLLSPCVFELHHQSTSARLHLLLEPGTFYIMRWVGLVHETRHAHGPCLTF